MSTQPPRPETSMPNFDPDDLADETEPKHREQDIRPSDLVVDREALPLKQYSADVLMLALYERSIPAENAGIVTDDDGPTTVAEVNPSYPSDERVWRVAYLTDLESTVPSWTDWDSDNARNSGHGFRKDIIAFHRTWKVAVPTYDFPESRLMPVGELTLPVDESPMALLDESTIVRQALKSVTLNRPDEDG